MTNTARVAHSLRVEYALSALIQRIENGSEFPDVSPVVARDFKVSEQSLIEAYDRFHYDGHRHEWVTS